MNATTWVETLRVLYGMNKKDFIECFGADGDYLWMKYTIDKNSDVFSFLCYLDNGNAQILLHFLLVKIETIKNKG